MDTSNIGRRVYGLGAVVLGATLAGFGTFAAIGLAAPANLPGYHLLAWGGAGLLILAGVAINVRRTEAVGALVLAALFGAWVALLVPKAAAHAMVWVSWENVAERTAMAMGGVLAYTQARSASAARAAGVARFARPLFGACLVVFGISEFVYSKFTASMVPTWLPPSVLFWTYLTGAAQIAAGLAVLSGVRARLAAVLLTAMYLIFSLIVHLPRVIADPSGLMHWSENAVNLVLVGAAWALADSLAKRKPKS